MSLKWANVVGGVAIIAAAATAASTAIAAEASGIAISVTQSTNVGRGTGQVVLHQDAPVFMGDVIKTNAVGDAQIRLSDNTMLVVGPNSLMTIDRFVLSSPDTAKQVTLNAVRGAFRFISGNSRHEAYTVNTPTATIGFRGTRVDFSVQQGVTSMAVLEGAADMCEMNNRSSCQRAVSDCGVVVSAPNTPIRRIDKKDERDKILTTDFPYVVRQDQLATPFQADISNCDIPAAAMRAARIREARERTAPPINRNDAPAPTITATVPPPAPPPPPPPPPPPSCGDIFCP
jgi:hypothetical protein